MKYAEENIKKNDIIVIANSDIYFDDTLKLLYGMNDIYLYNKIEIDLSNIIIALSRWQMVYF